MITTISVRGWNADVKLFEDNIRILMKLINIPLKLKGANLLSTIYL